MTAIDAAVASTRLERALQGNGKDSLLIARQIATVFGYSCPVTKEGLAQATDPQASAILAFQSSLDDRIVRDGGPTQDAVDDLSMMFDEWAVYNKLRRQWMIYSLLHVIFNFVGPDEYNGLHASLGRATIRAFNLIDDMRYGPEEDW